MPRNVAVNGLALLGGIEVALALLGIVYSFVLFMPRDVRQGGEFHQIENTLYTGAWMVFGTIVLAFAVHAAAGAIALYMAKEARTPTNASSFRALGWLGIALQVVMGGVALLSSWLFLCTGLPMVFVSFGIAGLTVWHLRNPPDWDAAEAIWE